MRTREDLYDMAINKEAKTRMNNGRALIFIKGALAALSQNKTFPADVAAAKTWLNDAIKELET